MSFLFRLTWTQKTSGWCPPCFVQPSIPMWSRCILIPSVNGVRIWSLVSLLGSCSLSRVGCFVPGAISSGELQDDQQRRDEDAAQSQRVQLHDQERRLRPRAPVVSQLHGEIKRGKNATLYSAASRRNKPPWRVLCAAGSPLQQIYF